MSDPASSAQIEDVLSSIRRLVSEESVRQTRAPVEETSPADDPLPAGDPVSFESSAPTFVLRPDAAVDAPETTDAPDQITDTPADFPALPDVLDALVLTADFRVDEGAAPDQTTDAAPDEQTPDSAAFEADAPSMSDLDPVVFAHSVLQAQEIAPDDAAENADLPADPLEETPAETLTDEPQILADEQDLHLPSWMNGTEDTAPDLALQPSDETAQSPIEKLVREQLETIAQPDAEGGDDVLDSDEVETIIEQAFLHHVPETAPDDIAPDDTATDDPAFDDTTSKTPDPFIEHAATPVAAFYEDEHYSDPNVTSLDKHREAVFELHKLMARADDPVAEAQSPAAQDMPSSDAEQGSPTITPLLHEEEAPLAEPVDEDERLVALDESVVDEEGLRDLVSQLVREELKGSLGERITRNVRKLVRREIHRALAAREFD